MYPREELIVSAGERVVVKAAPLNAETPPHALAAPLTPAGAHYLRSHFDMPLIDPARHSIAVGGALAQPYSLGLAELLALPRRHVTFTMECAGNQRVGIRPLPAGMPWDRGAVATASWSGVPLGLLLERAGVRDDVVGIVCRGADRGQPAGAATVQPFARALPIDKARDPDTIVALEMNGGPIPLVHGGPARLIVPGWYGMASVKWLERIEAVTTPFAGWFQSADYVYDEGAGRIVPVTEMRVRAHLVAPARDGCVPRGELHVWGWAWSGAAPIAGVDVGLDGDDYRAARLDALMAPHAWRRFELAIAVLAPGRHTLRARARDATGNVQPEVPRWNRLGFGNNAVLPIVFEVI
jgi:DMSO/TMAO reductase YedYZ molybdopterin-dependent catalytic subunit